MGKFGKKNEINLNPIQLPDTDTVGIFGQSDGINEPEIDIEIGDLPNLNFNI